MDLVFLWFCILLRSVNCLQIGQEKEGPLKKLAPTLTKVKYTSENTECVCVCEAQLTAHLDS